MAVDILEAIDIEKAYSNLLLNAKIKNKQVNEKDSGLLTELVYGTLQHQLMLDFIMDHFIKKPQKLEGWVKQLFRISFYQLEYLQNIPSHAVVSEAVEIAKIRGHQGISRLVNGVLRNFLRQGTPDASKIKNEDERLSIQYNLPIGLVKTLISEIGMNEFIKLTKSLNKPAKMSIRVNQKFITREEAIRQLQIENYHAALSQIAPSGIIGHSGLPIHTHLFEDGKITIQDESSMLVAEVLDLKKHHHVLDACAAPGGKTTHIAQFLSKENGGCVTAVDIHPHKVKLIKENALRMHVQDVVHECVADSTELSKRFGDEGFDRVLVDAPCSGLGLIRRKPEIRYHVTSDIIESLHQQQLNILHSAAKMVKLEGVLVYSTCTILTKENEMTVNDFLKEHPNFEKVEINNANVKHLQTALGQIKLYPHDFGTDGFFIQKFKKISD